MMKCISWAQLILGLWILASPWILGFSYVNIAMWSNIAAGLSIAILSLWELFGENPKNQ